MRPSYASPMLHISYWEFFKQYYTPMLKEVDILLKTIDEPISTNEAAKALSISETAVQRIMAKEDIELLDREGFLRIMMHGSSPICRLLQRECKCGSPDSYSPANIAYIYGLQNGHVAEVCHKNGYKEVPARSLPELLDKIYIFILPGS